MNTFLLILFGGALVVQLGFWLCVNTQLLLYIRKYSSSNTIQDEKYPSVSVVICAKNALSFLQMHLPAILDQDYPNFEVIIVDDGSKDGTYEYLKSLSQNNPKMLVLNIPPLEKKGKRKKYETN